MLRAVLHEAQDGGGLLASWTEVSAASSSLTLRPSPRYSMGGLRVQGAVDPADMSAPQGHGVVCLPQGLSGLLQRPQPQSSRLKRDCPDHTQALPVPRERGPPRPVGVYPWPSHCPPALGVRSKHTRSEVGPGVK